MFHVRETVAGGRERNAPVASEAPARKDQQMTMTAPPPGKKVNRIGLELQSYRGSKTTLCAGCGHNAISERVIDACYELGIDARQVLKLSGIGCSSKSPAYFLGNAHGFNSVHGRMPSVATGAMLANKIGRE